MSDQRALMAEIAITLSNGMRELRAAVAEIYAMPDVPASMAPALTHLQSSAAELDQVAASLQRLLATKLS